MRAREIAPAEPRLELDDIQGIAVPGFLKPHQTLLYLRVPASDGVSIGFRAFLAELECASGAATLADRRLARAAPQRRQRPREHHSVLTAVAFTYTGLLALVPGAAEMRSVAYKHGMVPRSALLGDPTDPSVEGHPARWVVGGEGKELDAMIVVAGDDRDATSIRARSLARALEETGVLVGLEDGDIRADAPGREHFGFDDGISQPGIRGRASENPHDYITTRHVDPRDRPAAWLYGYPGQELAWPGEFVFGYPATSPDPLLPGPLASCGPTWTRNGSFLVFRRLRQDVAAFWRTMRDEAMRLARLPGFEGLSEVQLASLLVGRWPSGAPVNRTPTRDLPLLGAERRANNNFLFDADAPTLQTEGWADPFPKATADPAGIACPWAAHIRKVNTRDSASDMGGASGMQSRRILRVGVPFGPSLPEAQKFGDGLDPADGNRGLLFLSIQTSIEEQFEFLQARWINDDARPKMPGGHDMVVGQNASTRDGVRRCPIFGRDFAQAEVTASSQFVIPTGGAYLFVPSLSALQTVIARPSAERTKRARVRSDG